MTAMPRVGQPGVFGDKVSVGLSVAGGLAALLVGFALASENVMALAAVAGVVAGPLLLLDPPLGAALWAPLPFIPAVPGSFGAERVSSVLLVVAWVGLLSTARGADVRAAIRRHRSALAIITGLAVFLGLSVVWARDAGQVGDELAKWYPALVIFAIVATAITDQRGVMLVVYGLAAGALLSVLIGLGMPQLTDSHHSVVPSQLAEGRMHGGEGDANLLAAVIVPTAVLLAGIFAVKRVWLTRCAIVGAILLLAVGLVATESRGGIVAALVAVLAAVGLFRERRGSVLWIAIMIAAVVAAAATASPEASQRLTLNDERLGSGRGDMWRIGYAISEDHPVLGVGLGNYVTVAPAYAQQAGSLTAGDLVIPGNVTVMHNTFLQLLVESGFIGLVLFSAVAWVCMRAALRATGEFADAGNAGMATFARTLVVAQIAALAASVFLYNGTDKRLWVLLALGPALANVAARGQRPAGATARP